MVDTISSEDVTHRRHRQDDAIQDRVRRWMSGPIRFRTSSNRDSEGIDIGEDDDDKVGAKRR